MQSNQHCSLVPSVMCLCLCVCVCVYVCVCVFVMCVCVCVFVCLYYREENVIAVASMNFDPIVAQAAQMLHNDKTISKREIQ